MSETNEKKISWTDARTFGSSKMDFSHDDWLEVAKIANSIDPSTIPEGIEIPDLRPREVIEAEAREKQAKKDS